MNAVLIHVQRYGFEKLAKQEGKDRTHTIYVSQNSTRGQYPRNIFNIYTCNDLL